MAKNKEAFGDMLGINDKKAVEGKINSEIARLQRLANKERYAINELEQIAGMQSTLATKQDQQEKFDEISELVDERIADKIKEEAARAKAKAEELGSKTSVTRPTEPQPPVYKPEPEKNNHLESMPEPKSKNGQGTHIRELTREEQVRELRRLRAENAELKGALEAERAKGNKPTEPESKVNKPEFDGWEEDVREEPDNTDVSKEQQRNMFEAARRAKDLERYKPALKVEPESSKEGLQKNYDLGGSLTPESEPEIAQQPYVRELTKEQKEIRALMEQNADLRNAVETKRIEDEDQVRHDRIKGSLYRENKKLEKELNPSAVSKAVSKVKKTIDRIR